MDDSKMRAQDQVDAAWSRTDVSSIHHHRLVLGEVGRALSTFECTKQLVTAVLDALKAHSQAFESASILHRDISVGNIVLTHERRGLLIDWDLAENADRRDRRGTWQFMSASLLRCPGKMHTLTDDLESFLHVLGWMSLRFVPAIDSYDSDDRRRDMFIFDEHFVHRGVDYGGLRKCDSLGAAWYPSFRFKPRKPTPLSGLLTQLSKPFESLYAIRPPTAEDRMKISVPLNHSDKRLCRLRAMIKQYDEDMQRLVSFNWFIDEISKVLGEQVWPTDDKADVDLPVD